MLTQTNTTKLKNRRLTATEQIFDSLRPAEEADRCVIEDVCERRTMVYKELLCNFGYFTVSG